MTVWKKNLVQGPGAYEGLEVSMSRMIQGLRVLQANFEIISPMMDKEQFDTVNEMQERVGYVADGLLALYGESVLEHDALIESMKSEAPDMPHSMPALQPPDLRLDN